MSLALVVSVAALAASSSDASDQGWFAAEARGVRVMTNASPSAASRTLAEIESAEALFKVLVGVAVPKPLRAFAVKDADSLRELAPQFWERRGVRPHSIAYEGPYHGFIAVREDLSPEARREALLHEYVHLLTAAQAPDAPAWLDEGLSEFWGSIVVENNRVIVGRPHRKHLARLKSWQPLQRTMTRQRGEFIADSEPAEQFYAQSWALVHYLLLGRSATEPLKFIPEYRDSLGDLEGRLREYVSKAQLRELTLPLTAQYSTVATSSFVPEARSLAERARMVVFGARPNAAMALAKRALTLDSRDALALEVAGTYYFLNNQPYEARRWLTRAFDTKSASPATAIYLALLTPVLPQQERYLMMAVGAQPDLDIAWQRLTTIYSDDGRLDQLRAWCSVTRTLALPWLGLANVPQCH